MFTTPRPELPERGLLPNVDEELDLWRNVDTMPPDDRLAAGPPAVFGGDLEDSDMFESMP